MRTDKEVKEHLLNNGYTDDAINKIMGFVIGAGLKENSEEWKVRRGEKTWKDFYTWYESNVKEAIESLISEIMEKIENAKDIQEENLRITQLELLLGIFSDYEE